MSSSGADPPSWLDGSLLSRALGVPRVAEFSVAPATGKGENYASVVYRCTVRVEGEEEERRVVFKCLPSNAMRRMFCNKAQIFRKERDVYMEILPRYAAMLSEAQPGRRNFPWPEHLDSAVDGERDYVALVDLGPKGFSMAQRMKGLDADHLSLVLSALGEFHACSVAQRARSTAEEFASVVVEPFRDLMYAEDAQDMHRWVEKGIETVAGMVGTWGGDAFGTAGRWLARWAPRAHTDIMALLRPDRPGALLCHGDTWLNNMLFRYHQPQPPNGEEGKAKTPAEVKLLDFQVARYSSPATDLLYLMVTSTTAATRKQHWACLLEQEYLGTFWKTLDSLAVKESVRDGMYSADWLRGEMRQLALWALLNAVIVLRAVVLEAKDAPDLDTLTEEDLKLERDVFQGSDDSVYQERLHDLICEFSNDGLFDG